MPGRLYYSKDGKSFEEISEVNLAEQNLKLRIYVFVAIGNYIKDYTDLKKSKYTRHNERTYFSCFYEFLCKKEIWSLDKITHDVIVSYRNLLRKRVENSTVNRQFSTFGHFFNLMFETDKISKNPCRLIKDLPEKKPIIQIWTFLDFRICLRWACPRLKEILVFLWLTGARTCEAINLKYSDIDYRRRVIYLYTGKVGSEQMREIELTTAIERHIHRIKMNGAYVFGRGSPYTNYGLLQSVQRVVKSKCTNKKLDVKGIRHSFCTNQFLLGIPSAIIQLRMGHKKLATTERYKHLVRKHVQKFVS